MESRLSARGDELLYLRRYEEAARQFELVLHECGDKSDADTTALRIETLHKLGDLRHFYLNDQDGALRTYRRITEISPAGKLAFETRRKIIKLMKFRSTEPELLHAEIEALMNSYPGRVDDERWNLELAQLMLNARKYAKAEAYAQKVLKSTKMAYRARAALLIASAQELGDRVALAKKTYEELLKEQNLPDDLKQITTVSLAHCLEKMGQLKAARVAYLDAQKATKNSRFLDSRIQRIERLILEQVGDK
ncbi:MAG: hypothetical protein VYC39_08515 [Myxococcota bacterium]|nr:hypothetical protein [Myxococcota bacterium]